MRRPFAKVAITPYAENLCESGISCLLTMVQGNVLALTLSHWLIASQTGLLAGAIVGTTVIAARLRQPWVVAVVLGVATMAVDALVHPGTFGVTAVTEAVVTGIGAFVLSLAVAKIVRWAKRSAPANRLSL